MVKQAHLYMPPAPKLGPQLDWFEPGDVLTVEEFVEHAKAQERHQEQNENHFPGNNRK